MKKSSKATLVSLIILSSIGLKSTSYASEDEYLDNVEKTNNQYLESKSDIKDLDEEKNTLNNEELANTNKELKNDAKNQNVETSNDENSNYYESRKKINEPQILKANTEIVDKPIKAEEKTTNIWVEDSNGRYFLDGSGQKCKGIYKIGLNKYYFANDGKLKTNTKIITNKGAYIIKEDGVLNPVENRWIHVNNNAYHTDQKGGLNKGLYKIENNHYNFDLKTGILERNKIFINNNRIFNIDGNGVISLKSNSNTTLGNYEYLTDNSGRINKKSYSKSYINTQNTLLSKKISSIVNNEVKKMKGNWQVAIDSIYGESNIHLDIKNSINQPSASTIKIFVALEAYKQIESRRISEKNISSDIYYMLQRSDNNATNRLIKKLGFNNINNTIKSICGENKTKLNRYMLSNGRENMARSKDLNKALIAISKGHYISKKNANKIIKAMDDNNSTSKTKLLAKLESYAKGVNKSGELPNKGVQNDIAIINVGKSKFALSVLSYEKKPNYSTSSPQFKMIQNLGKEISKAFKIFEDKLIIK